MIKILDSSKSLSSLVNDNTNGLGQFEAKSCLVTEELNGIYEADITMLATDKHFEDLEVGGLLEIEASDTGKQIFRIYYISKPINQVVEIKAQHITYDLNKIPVKPFSSVGAVNTKNAMISNIIGEYPFTMSTDITNTTSTFTLDIPRSFRECLGGYEGSILDVFRCEYEWDNLEVKMLAERGSDNGVRIAYGKNLTDFTQEENIENVYTSVMGYAIVDEVVYYGDVYDKVVATYPKVLIVDFSDKYESGDIPTTTELNNYATSYANNNPIEVPNVNLTISFVPLYQTEEYKNIAPLERVSLGDTVRVYFDKLGVEATSRVVKTVYNSNLHKYDSIELGRTKANLNTILNEVVESVDNNIVSSESYLKDYITNFSKLIANGMGLHVTIDSSNRIFLHNEEDLANSQYQYMITANGFVLSDDYGQTWNSGWSTSGEAVVNSLATITLKALEIQGSVIRGSTIIFGDVSDKYITAQPYSGGITFDGTGTIRMQPQEAFFLNNLTADGNNFYNRMSFSKNGTSSNNYIMLLNYDDTQNYIFANFIELDAHYSSTPYNRLVIQNYKTNSGTSYSANMILMTGGASSGASNELTIRNNLPDTNLKKNGLYMSSSTSANQNVLLENYGRYTNSTNYLANVLRMNHISGNRNILTLANYHPSLFNGTSTLNANFISLDSHHNNANSIEITNYDSSGKRANDLILYSNLTNGNCSFRLENGRYDISGTTSWYTRNRMEFISDTTLGTYIYIGNNNSSGNAVNYINLNATNEQMVIFSNSDVHINSNGAVRLTSGNSQNINLTSADDVVITYTDKFKLNNRIITFSSDGYVKWYYE